jgi:hypothetical protein
VFVGKKRQIHGDFYHLVTFFTQCVHILAVAEAIPAIKGSAGTRNYLKNIHFEREKDIRLKDVRQNYQVKVKVEVEVKVEVKV